MHGPYPKKTAMTELSVRENTATPDQKQAYSGLMGLYGLASCADGIKAFVIGQLQRTGLWGLSGHRRWKDFCEEVLCVSRKTADRMCSDGWVANEFVKLQQSDYEKLLKMTETAKVGPFLLDAAIQRTDAKQLAVLTDRKVQRALKAVPEPRRVEVIEHAAATGHGITSKSVNAVIDKLDVRSERQAKVQPVVSKLGDRKRTKIKNRVLHNLRMAYKGLKEAGLLDPFEDRITTLAKDIEKTFLVAAGATVRG